MPDPRIPVDAAALDAIEHALGGGLTHTAEDGTPLAEPRRVGADFGLPQLLAFWAGQDPDEEGVLVGYGLGDLPIYDDTGQPAIHHDDLIGALVTEIRRLRAAAGP